MTKAYVVVCQEPDSYDVGTHTAPLEAFDDRETAERLIDGLIGKRKSQAAWDNRVWSPCDELEIEEWEIRESA